ncbi:MAG: flagellar hook-length control protein FliK [Candidatus Polarisedimenticolaceae bacterium]|nr:flagellar hook-length control protein FliK [Candidatus Polarisedimenticolaceae bacterium]
MVNLFSSTPLTPQTTGGTTAPGLPATEAGSSEAEVASGDFAELLSTESSMVEILEELKMLLSAEDFAQLESMLAEGQINISAEGQTLPVEEILAALQQQLSEAGAEGGVEAAADIVAEQAEALAPVEQAVVPMITSPIATHIIAPVPTAAPVPIPANQVVAMQQAGNKKVAPPVAAGQAVTPSTMDNDALGLPLNPNNTSADSDQQPPTGQHRTSEALLAQAAQKAPVNNLFRTTEAGLTAINSVPVVPSGVTLQNTLQPAVLNPLNAALPIHTPMGERGWDQAMGERILWMVGRQVQSAEVRITPPQLGPVDIRISIRNDQANVTFTAQHGVVREALEASIPRLRDMLNENNLQLANVDVNQRNAGEGRSSSHSFSQPSFGEQDAEGYEIEEDALALRNMRTIQSDALVDDFA